MAVRGEVQYISNILIINISFKKILIRITRRITKTNLCYFFAELTSSPAFRQGRMSSHITIRFQASHFHISLTTITSCKDTAYKINSNRSSIQSKERFVFRVFASLVILHCGISS